MLLRDFGRYSETHMYFQEVMALHQQLGNRLGIATASTNVNLIAAAHGEYSEACQWYEQCHALCTATSDQRGQSMTRNNLGEVSVTIGEYQQALHFLQQALALSRSLGYLARQAERQLEWFGTQQAPEVQHTAQMHSATRDLAATAQQMLAHQQTLFSCTTD